MVLATTHQRPLAYRLADLADKIMEVVPPIAHANEVEKKSHGDMEACSTSCAHIITDQLQYLHPMLQPSHSASTRSLVTTNRNASPHTPALQTHRLANSDECHHPHLYWTHSPSITWMTPKSLSTCFSSISFASHWAAGQFPYTWCPSAHLVTGDHLVTSTCTLNNQTDGTPLYRPWPCVGIPGGTRCSITDTFQLIWVLCMPFVLGMHSMDGGLIFVLSTYSLPLVLTMLWKEFTFRRLNLIQI